MKKKPINYFYGVAYNKDGEDTYWENAMIRLSENYIYLYRKYDCILNKNLPDEYKHFMILKHIGNVPM